MGETNNYEGAVSISKTRVLLYQIARFLGDIQAVRRDESAGAWLAASPAARPQLPYANYSSAHESQGRSRLEYEGTEKVTTEADNEMLGRLYMELRAQLNFLDSQLVHRDAYHVQHGELCKRARQFAGYSDASVFLAEQQRFPQAFSLLTSALEHWAVDAVMMLGDRFVRHYSGNSEGQLEDVTDQSTVETLPSDLRSGAT